MSSKDKKTLFYVSIDQKYHESLKKYKPLPRNRKRLSRFHKIKKSRVVAFKNRRNEVNVNIRT